MTINELRNSKDYEYHHTASRRGYVSRKLEGVVERYKGRYGEGYVILWPRKDTSQYVYVSYYIKKSES